MDIIEFIVDIAVELIYEKGENTAKSKRTPKPIRYIVSALIILFYAAGIAALAFSCMVCWHKNIAAALILLAICLLAVGAGIKTVAEIKRKLHAYK